MNKKLLFLLLGLVGLLVFASLPIFPKFTVTNQNTGRLVYVRDLKQATDFYISFIHSVNKVPVLEYYSASGNKLTLYKTVFKSYGAGMPDLNPGNSIEMKNGEITLSGIDTELEDFSVFVGTIAEHKVVFSGEELRLTELAPPQSLLSFKIKNVSLLQLLIYNVTGG